MIEIEATYIFFAVEQSDHLVNECVDVSIRPLKRNLAMGDMKAFGDVGSVLDQCTIFPDILCETLKKLELRDVKIVLHTFCTTASFRLKNGVRGVVEFM